MEHFFIIHSEEDIERVADDFAGLLHSSNAKVVTFYGNMGVGKTTFIRGICRSMGVKGPVTSPSFAIVNEYATERGATIFHFDFYRIKKEEEVFDMGYEDYFFSNHLCLIEWPEKVSGVLPANRLDVFMVENSDGSRTISVDV